MVSEEQKKRRDCVIVAYQAQLASLVSREREKERKRVLITVTDWLTSTCTYICTYVNITRASHSAFKVNRSD